MVRLLSAAPRNLGTNGGGVGVERESLAWIRAHRSAAQTRREVDEVAAEECQLRVKVRVSGV